MTQVGQLEGRGSDKIELELWDSRASILGKALER